MKQKEIELLRSLSLEDRAKMPEKEPSCMVMLIIFLCGLIPGLYYWFGEEFIFDYLSVSPFWGFAIFTAAAIILLIAVNLVYMSVWKEYNEEIKQANKDILAKIKKGEGTEQDLFRMKKEYIERKIGKEPLSQEEFEWHTKRYCWGCGKQHAVCPKLYTITKERTESWKEGAFRYSKTFKQSGSIYLCPQCYSRLVKAKEISDKNSHVALIVDIIITVIIIAGAFIVSSIGWNIEPFLVLVIAPTVGQIILIPLSFLLAYPFADHKGDFQTKWNLDEIPSIRRFMNMKLPHTH